MPHITVISTFSQDRYFHVRTGVRETKRGGPAFWIRRTLSAWGLLFTIVHAPEDAIVDITVDETGERGTIASLPALQAGEIPYADAYLVSTIGAEFNIAQISGFAGLVAVDVQGYVRDARMKGLSAYTFPPHVQDTISILKGTEEEISYLDPASVEAQKHRILVITRGSQGFDLYASGMHIPVPGHPIHARDTVGAGDVLLAAFVASYVRSGDSHTSARAARQHVEEFLATKQ